MAEKRTFRAAYHSTGTSLRIWTGGFGAGNWQWIEGKSVEEVEEKLRKHKNELYIWNGRGGPYPVKIFLDGNGEIRIYTDYKVS